MNLDYIIMIKDTPSIIMNAGMMNDIDTIQKVINNFVFDDTIKSRLIKIICSESSSLNNAERMLAGMRIKGVDIARLIRWPINYRTRLLSSGEHHRFTDLAINCCQN